MPHENGAVDQSQGPGQWGRNADSPEAKPVDGEKTAERPANQLTDTAEYGVGAVAHARQSIRVVLICMPSGRTEVSTWYADVRNLLFRGSGILR